MAGQLAVVPQPPAPAHRLQVMGFSGTNDNHRLLPLQVRQHLEVEQSLKATNGKLLALLLDNPRYDTLELQVGSGREERRLGKSREAAQREGRSVVKKGQQAKGR